MTSDLDPRHSELMQAFVAAWEASSHTPFDLNEGPFEHPAWPADVPVPNRDEVRSLKHLGLLDSDEGAAPRWRVFPSAEARQQFATDAEADVAAALSDPDRRLGLILEAAVAAFEADPSEPLHFASMQQVDFVQHAHWPLQPDVVRPHDIQQLQGIGLLDTAARGEDFDFWPTEGGRAAVKDPAGYLSRLAEETGDEAERSRLGEWAERLRAGDLAVGTLAGGVSGLLIRVLMGA